MRYPVVAAILAGLGLFGGVAALAQNTPEKAHVDHRRAVMTGSGLAGVSLARMAGGLIEPQNVAGLARYWATGARLAEDAFKADTRGTGVESKSKDAVWETWDDFSARMKAYADDVEAIALLAESGDTAGALAKVGPTLREHCKACHDDYRKD